MEQLTFMVEDQNQTTVSLEFKNGKTSLEIVFFYMHVKINLKHLWRNPQVISTYLNEPKRNEWETTSLHFVVVGAMKKFSFCHITLRHCSLHLCLTTIQSYIKRIREKPSYDSDEGILTTWKTLQFVDQFKYTIHKKRRLHVCSPCSSIFLDLTWATSDS